MLGMEMFRVFGVDLRGAGSFDSVRLAPHALKMTGIEIRQISNALALTADQHARHLVRDLASFGEGCVGTVPAGVIGIVTGGASFAVIALATAGAMQDDLMRPREPVFVNKELRGLGHHRGRLGDEANLGCDLLEPVSAR